MFDETTDISHISQLSLVLRYFNKDSVREDFIFFVNVHQVNFENNDAEPKITVTLLGKTVVKIMNQNGLNLDYCIGICTDTYSVMASEQNKLVLFLK